MVGPGQPGRGSRLRRRMRPGGDARHLGAAPGNKTCSPPSPGSSRSRYLRPPRRPGQRRLRDPPAAAQHRPGRRLSNSRKGSCCPPWRGTPSSGTPPPPDGVTCHLEGRTARQGSRRAASSAGGRGAGDRWHPGDAGSVLEGVVRGRPVGTADAGGSRRPAAVAADGEPWVVNFPFPQRGQAES